MQYDYYYNVMPNGEKWRNNLIYTSLISQDKKTFVQWYHNDTEYHRGQNKVVDPSLMEEKWLREVNHITQMRNAYPELVPKILNIDLEKRKIYLEIDGPDFWQLAGTVNQNYDSVLPNWREQMMEIFKAHKSLGIYKYSLHPSSYFVVDGRLKSINYFFCYKDHEPHISLQSVMSHISEDRQADLFPKMAAMGIDVNKPTPFVDIQMLAFESFKTNYPAEFMEQAKALYV